MSNIDEVISRSRQGGTFTERKSFTVARNRAIQKMREFALVDPHYYVLELIQSAVGNGATYIDIQADKTSSAMSYVGGSFREAELAQLFDFLFASKDDVEHGPIRQLALGINALMNFEPAEIVIETGDGTLRGTTRVEIRGKDDVVDVGTPEQALNGTFIRATGMKRRRARSSSLKVIDGHPREYQAVENRCIVAPVPILFNHNPLFGYTSQRTPRSLYGYTKTVSFDEGDFYGTIGLARRHSGATFRLITHGVWIESVRQERGDDVGGVIAFDGLRKTADHSSIVKDDRYQEMWLRLRPYLNQLRGDTGVGSGFEVFTLDGEKLANDEILTMVRSFERILSVSRIALNRPTLKERALEVAQALDVPVVAASREMLEQLKILAGPGVELLRPDLDDDKMYAIFREPETPLPSSPWLVAPVELPSFGLMELGERLPWPEAVAAPKKEFGVDVNTKESFSVRALLQCVWMLDMQVEEGQSPEDWKMIHLDPLGKSIKARVYTPQGGQSARYENAEVRVAERVVWRTHADGIAPGQILVIDVQDLAVTALWNAPKGGLGARKLGDYLVEMVVNASSGQIENAASAGLRAALRADVSPKSGAARLMLSALANRVVRRIQTQREGPRVVFSLLDQTLEMEVLERPVFETLEGGPVSLRALERLMDACHGLVYGVRSDVEADLRGLDRTRILALDPVDEGLLVALVGPGAYVRVDGRDVLAKGETLVVRDIAAGLKEYDDMPMPVEGRLDDGESLSALSEFSELLARLIPKVQQPGVGWDGIENRRQAWRHLQSFALRREEYEWAEELSGVDELPLFRISGNRTISMNRLRQELQKREKVVMLDGWAKGAAEMSVEESFGSRVFDDEEVIEPLLLAMDPFVLYLLGDRVEGAAEHELSPNEVDALKTEADLMLESVVIDDEELQGFVGIPLRPVANPAVLFFGKEKDAHLLADLGDDFGVVGKVRLRGQDQERGEKELRRHVRDLIGHLLGRLPGIIRAGDEQDLNRAIFVLLRYATNHLHFFAHLDGSLTCELGWDALAQEIMNAPMFVAARGLPLTPMDLVLQFKRQAWFALGRGEAFVFRPEGLGASQPEMLGWFTQEFLRLERIQKPPRVGHDEVRGVYPRLPAKGEALTLLEFWLNRLRPDQESWQSDEDDRNAYGLVLDQESRFFEPENKGEFCRYQAVSAGRKVVWINPHHEFYEQLEAEGDMNPRALAWALLAAYAHINHVEEPITNQHEMAFQRRVAEALETGFGV